jgi:hypothetical protein
MKIIVGPMIDNKFCMLLEMSKINYDSLLTEIILLYNLQRINGFLFFIFVKYYGVEGFG